MEQLEDRWVPDGDPLPPPSPPIPPPAIVVTTELDVVDDNDAFLSLREAISYVNLHGSTMDQQRITFASNLAGKTFWLNSRLPDIEKNIFIDGLGRDQLIQRDSSKGNFGLLFVKDVGTLKVAHLTLSSGLAAINLGGGIGGGGAIYAVGDPTVTDCAFAGNSVASTLEFGAGGAIRASGKANAQGDAIGSLTILDSTFYCNWANFGGAVMIDTGVLNTTLQNSEFMENTASVSGGAIYHVGEVDPNAVIFAVSTINHCTFDLNTAGQRGGGIYAEAVYLSLTDQTMISNNRASTGGGVCIVGQTLNNRVYGFLFYAGVSIGGNTASVTGSGVYRETAASQIVPGTGGVTWFGNPPNSAVFVP